MKCGKAGVKYEATSTKHAIKILNLGGMAEWAATAGVQAIDALANDTTTVTSDLTELMGGQKGTSYSAFCARELKDYVTTEPPTEAMLQGFGLGYGTEAQVNALRLGGSASGNP